MSDSLTDLLIRSRQLLPVQVEQALQAAEASSLSLASVLLERGILHEDTLLHLLQTHLQLPLYDPSHPPSTDALRMLSQQEAERMLVLPLERNPEALVVAMVDPLDSRTFEELVFLTGREIKPLIGRYSDLKNGIRDGYRRVATKVMGAQKGNAINAIFGGDLELEQLDTRPDHQALKIVARRLDALIEILEQKGLVYRQELAAALRDLDLEDADE